MAAYTTIDNPELYFACKLYTGNGSDNHAITFDQTDTSMQPDMVWMKSRSQSGYNHTIVDSVRGPTKVVRPLISDEDTYSDAFKSFDSNGFTLDDDASNSEMNQNTETYVAWAWKAGTSFSNDASATSVGNTDSSGSASSTAGFSISTYTGAGSSLDIVVKHGLSVKPDVMWTKNREDNNNWGIYHKNNTSAPETDYLRLDQTNATTDDAEMWHDTEPTSAVFTAGDHSSSNRAGDDFVAYFWNEIQGFSKFGSYVGNGNADGPFVWTGFRPAWIMFKPTGESADWTIVDNKRNTYNPTADKTLNANLNTAEHDGGMDMDILSNGFKVRNANTDNNSSNAAGIVYMAFAESPFVNSNGVPTNAR
jgi:hypothetical protein